MKKEPKKKTIALFMILGLALLIGLVSKNLLEEYMADQKNMVVMYFSESIAGLNVGSPVVYEGVTVGKVVKIEIKTDPKTLEFRIPVYIRFASDGDISHMSFSKNITHREFMDLLIQKGLRARLTTQNLLTGQLMIELLMLPDAPLVYQQKGDTKYFEIPTALSPYSNFMRDIEELPLKQIIFKIDSVFEKLDKDLPPVLQSYTNLGQNLNEYVENSVPQTNQSLNQLNRTLKDISNAAQSVKNLADYLEQHPDSILKGK